MTGSRDPDLARRKLTDAALVLPVAGAFLLMPPFIRVFVTDGTVAGIPVVVVYLFTVWFALIGLAGWLAAPLRRTMQTDIPPVADPEASDADRPEA